MLAGLVFALLLMSLPPQANQTVAKSQGQRPGRLSEEMITQGILGL
jgi:hypothetical protein